jgi:hypothetical protein
MRKKIICTKIIKHTDIFCLFVYDSKPKMKTVMFSGWLMPNEEFFSNVMARKSYISWDDDCLVLDLHA